MKKYILSFAAVAAMLASCSQDAHLEIAGNDTENNTPQPITTIYASSENGTRAAVNGDGTKILWQDGDKIGVIKGTMTNPFTLTTGTGTTSGEFSNAESNITRIEAVMYPYQEDATFANNKLSFEIPTVQEGVKGSFDKNAAIMYAIGSSANPQLSLAVNFLKVTIPNDDVVRSVTISSPSTPLTGKMELQDRNVSEVIDEGCNYVRLIPANGATHFTRGDYYIAVKPGEIVTPTISFIESTNDDCTLREKSKTSTQSIQFLGNNNVMPLNVDFYTTRTAVQLWAGGPYFAQYNVGVTDSKQTSFGDYYAWGGCQDRVDDHWTGEGKLTGNHDTATKLWGANWRMPTAAELQALLDNCDAGNSAFDGEGFKFSGRGDYAGNSVFLPAGRDTYGYNARRYWSSTPDDSDSDMAKNLYLSSYDKSMESSDRTKGYCVRAVLAVQ
ncbi:MAG: hypothetical protein KBT39_10155 [Bacteroidales bacterium]|nr:hypothetical protein [Bacteroidales bacterium]